MKEVKLKCFLTPNKDNCKYVLRYVLICLNTCSYCLLLIVLNKWFNQLITSVRSVILKDHSMCVYRQLPMLKICCGNPEKRLHENIAIDIV